MVRPVLAGQALAAGVVLLLAADLEAWRGAPAGATAIAYVVVVVGTLIALVVVVPLDAAVRLLFGLIRAVSPRRPNAGRLRPPAPSDEIASPEATTSDFP